MLLYDVLRSFRHYVEESVAPDLAAAVRRIGPKASFSATRAGDSLNISIGKAVAASWLLARAHYAV